MNADLLTIAGQVWTRHRTNLAHIAAGVALGLSFAAIFLRGAW